MGLPLRITFNDNDYVYQIVNSIKDEKKVWKLKDDSLAIDPELVQALGRSVSLRLRM
jgi:hypothetical protein